MRKLLAESTAAHLKEFAAAWPESLISATIQRSRHRGSGARRPGGRARRRQGRVHRRRAARRTRSLSHPQAAPAIGRSGAGRSARSPRRTASAPRLRALRHVRRLLLAASVGGGANSAPRSASCSTICSASAVCARSGYWRLCADRSGRIAAARVSGVKYVHKKGRVLAGFREREKPYIADVRRCEVLLAPLADLPQELAALVETLDHSRENAAGRSGGGDAATALVFRVLETPGRRGSSRKSRPSAPASGVQIFLQSGGLDTVRPLRRGLPAAELRRGWRRASSSSSGRSISSR